MEMTEEKMGAISLAVLRLFFKEATEESTSNKNIDASISNTAEIFKKLPKELGITLNEFFVYFVRMLPEKYRKRYEEKIKEFMASQELLADPFEPT
jgi:hypothetical protein